MYCWCVVCGCSDGTNRNIVLHTGYEAQRTRLNHINDSLVICCVFGLINGIIRPSARRVYSPLRSFAGLWLKSLAPLVTQSVQSAV